MSETPEPGRRRDSPRSDGAPSRACRGWLRLARCPGVSPRRALALVDRVGDAASFAEPDEPALLGAGVPLELVARLRARPLGRRIARECRSARRGGLTILSLDDPGYPPLARQLAVPPLVLTVRGDLSVLARPAVAIVGSRAATPYGLAHAARLAAGLVRAGLPVVSGMARGIDAAAHRAALDEGGLTVAVLGTGADRVYPREHAELARRIAGSGALVSEFPPGMPPKPGHFPRRNRLIAGLSLAVVIVEAAERSGSLVTARWAAEEGRAVLAAPGRAGEPTSSGTLGLLRDGAALACSVEDVLAELPAGLAEGEAGSPAISRRSRAAAAALERVTGDARLVFDGLPPHDGRHVDELIDDLRLPCERVLAALFELEIAGLVSKDAGGVVLRSPAASGTGVRPGS